MVLLSISGDQYWPVCDQTKLYALGEVDERFGLSHEDALAALNIAAHIWNDALDKELFSYHPDARFRVDFLYDERQQKTVVYDENERALQSL